MNASSRAFSPPASPSEQGEPRADERALAAGSDSAARPAARGPADLGAADGGPADYLFRLMADCAPGAMLLLDLELNVVWANRSAAGLIGRTGGTLAGVPWRDLSLPWELDEGLRGRLLAGERVQLEGAPSQGRDGSNRLLWAHLTPLLDPANGPGAAVSAIGCTFEAGAASPPAETPELDYRAALESAQGGMW